MSNIFTRKALNDIMNNEGLTPEQRTEQVFGLYGRALDDGYIAKGAAAQAQETALANAKAEWEKTITHTDPKESDEYKALQGQFSDYKAMQQARGTEDYKRVKDKFFETVYGMIDRGEGAKPVSEQMAQIESQWGEYFNPAQDQGKGGQQPKNTPQYSQQPAGRPGANPTSAEEAEYQRIIAQW